MRGESHAPVGHGEASMRPLWGRGPVETRFAARRREPLLRASVARSASVGMSAVAAWKRRWADKNRKKDRWRKSNRSASGMSATVI